VYKFVVVTDPDMAAGFRLAGVDVIEVPTLEDAKRILPPLLYRDDTGIVAVNEEFMAVLDNKLMEKLEKSYRPIIIPIPSKSMKMDRTGYLERLLQRAIGYNIVLKR
jgi:V/A-type H+-transporting ATPase subunit F